MTAEEKEQLQTAHQSLCATLAYLEGLSKDDLATVVDKAKKTAQIALNSVEIVLFKLPALIKKN